jgi:transposase InsO family protein
VSTVWFEVLFVFVVLAHDRRRVLHFNVTAHPTAAWTAQQILEAFPFETVPKYLLRDRDAIYGHVLQQQIEAMGIEEVLGAPRSPWQRAYVERMIGSIRRDCLDHLIVLDESSLRRLLRRYFDYYHESRTPLSLDKDEPLDRWTHSFNIWSHPSRQPLSVLSKTSFFRNDHRETTASSLVRIGFGPLASNRPNGGVFGRDT